VSPEWASQAALGDAPAERTLVARGTGHRARRPETTPALGLVPMGARTPGKELPSWARP